MATEPDEVVDVASTVAVMSSNADTVTPNVPASTESDEVVDFPSMIAAMSSNADNITPSVPVPTVIDISELLESQAAVQAQEATDRATLSVLLNQKRETLRPQLFIWAAAGFPAIYVIQQFTVSPPAVCSDGVARNVYDYVVYLLGQEMGPTIAAIQALCVGIEISYSFMGNTLRIHASRT
jgi:hypothetical protein